ncbi:MAG: class I SAM-dependent methyltransferase [Chitinophagales bacterium]
MTALTYNDVQARVGATSAHPGAFIATLELLAHLHPRPGARVLECGCGTGRTAVHLAHLGAKVTAVDRNGVMLEKARRRAAAEGVLVDWREGDIRALPFADGQFDLVLAESVSVFNALAEVIPEYFRVVAPGGRVADLEIAARPGLPPASREALCRFFGFVQLPTLAEWKDAYRAAGFSPVALWRPRRLDLTSLQRSNERYPDPHNLSDPGVADDPEVQAMLLENGLLMAANHRHLAFAATIGVKPAPGEQPGRPRWRRLWQRFQV